MAVERNPAFEALLDFLKRNRGFDFTGYKRATLTRRVTRRMQSLGIDDVEAYQDYLELHQGEFTHLFNTILINVTRFFRDPDAWDHLRSTAIRQLAESSEDRQIRVWSAGCASGEEAYTLAMVLAEELGAERFKSQVKIYATDVDEADLDVARHGVYDAKAVANVPPPLLETYFDETAGRHVFRKDYRRCIIFGRHDLMQDAPISRVDVLTCRNVLMYFNAEAQTRILNRFHFSLVPDGAIMLGQVEMLLAQSDLFTPIDPRRRIFKRSGAATLRERLAVLAREPRPPTPEPAPREARERSAAFDVVPVAAVVIDGGGFLTAANYRARTLFGLRANDLGRPFQDLELSYRPVELRSWIERVRRNAAAERVADVEWHTSNGQRLWLTVDVSPVANGDAAPPGDVTISFLDNSALRQLRDELTHANRELEVAYEELQSTNEELETTNEELQSTVEELETTNEELQSTNEELETMNEELQSTNEELHGMNRELQSRESELHKVASFLETMLSAMSSGVVVVDTELRVEVWNAGVEDLFGLRQDEVKGRHLSNLDSGLPVAELSAPVRHVINENFRKEVTIAAHNRLGRGIRCSVMMAPMANEADGTPRGAVLLIREVADG